MVEKNSEKDKNQKPPKKLESDESESEGDDMKSNFLSDCERAFGTADLYAALNLDKNTATTTDIKKAYYKLSLRYHPDKVTDELLKEESKVKFQCLGKIYSILSDETKKNLYDQTGMIDGEDDLFRGDHQDWDDYFRTMFKKVTKDDINKFFEGYKESKEEREDLIKIYEKYEGDMEMIMIQMISDDCVESEPRFREILLDAIEKEATKKFDKFINESKKKATKRKAHYEKEAKEAEEIRKEMGIDDSQDSLRNMILSRRKDASANFLDNLAAKYSKKQPGKTKVFKGKTSRRAESKSESEIENENEDESEESEDSDAGAPPVKRKSSMVKKKPASKRNSLPKRKVKRL